MFENVLPKKINSGTKKNFEDMGFIFGENVDSIFCKGSLPYGWKIERTDHGMWYNILDEHNRKRASMFYKGAIYDYDSFLNANLYYNISVDPINGWSDNNRNKQWIAIVKDYDGEIVWESEPTVHEPNNDTHREEWLKWYDDKDNLRNIARKWLDENFPDWKNPTAYWNE